MNRVQQILELLKLNDRYGDEDIEHSDYPDIDPITLSCLYDLFCDFVPISKQLIKFDCSNKAQLLPKTFIDMYNKISISMNSTLDNYHKEIGIELRREEYFDDYLHSMIEISENDTMYELETPPTVSDIPHIVDSFDNYICVFEKLEKDHSIKYVDNYKECKEFISEYSDDFKKIKHLGMKKYA